eukprot:912285-Prorocentrum_minimum.AAC.3
MVPALVWQGVLNEGNVFFQYLALRCHPSKRLWVLEKDVSLVEQTLPHQGGHRLVSRISYKRIAGSAALESYRILRNPTTRSQSRPREAGPPSCPARGLVPC